MAKIIAKMEPYCHFAEIFIGSILAKLALKILPLQETEDILLQLKS